MLIAPKLAKAGGELRHVEHDRGHGGGTEVRRLDPISGAVAPPSCTAGQKRVDAYTRMRKLQATT